MIVKVLHFSIKYRNKLDQPRTPRDERRRATHNEGS